MAAVETLASGCSNPLRLGKKIEVFYKDLNKWCRGVVNSANVRFEGESSDTVVDAEDTVRLC